MKHLRNLLCAAFLLSAFISQAQTTTIVLVRHAEKETTTMSGDPVLSAAGTQRAQQLVQALSEFTINQLYSTNFIRTRATLEPLAAKTNLAISLYDPRAQEAFAATLKEMKGKTIVVSGHSNTIPRLVNLLIDAPGKYPDLDDSVYDKIYIVRIIDGVPTCEIRTY